MKIVMTGGTGFVGRQLGKTLLKRGHQLTVVARDPVKVAECFPDYSVSVIPGDLYNLSPEQLACIAQADAVAHLAWPKLPNYQALFHLEETLPKEMAFLKSLLASGLRRLLVTGTCFEYGLQNGCLSEESATQPVTAYGQAKDNLRAYLELLSKEKAFSMTWARLFYIHGPAQHPASLLAQLNQAIDRQESEFPMSGGEQLRDYLHVSEVAERLANLLENDCPNGVVNICSGMPVSIRSLVEQQIAGRNAKIQPLLGRFPYPTHEPMAFWGNTEKYRALVTTKAHATKRIPR